MTEEPVKLTTLQMCTQGADFGVVLQAHWFGCSRVFWRGIPQSILYGLGDESIKSCIKITAQSTGILYQYQMLERSPETEEPLKITAAQICTEGVVLGPMQ